MSFSIGVGLKDWQRMNGIDSMYTLIQGMFNKKRLRDILRNFIFVPDNSKKEEKIVCRYPQYYATRVLYESIKAAQKPKGDGKGGNLFWSYWLRKELYYALSYTPFDEK